MKTGACVSIIIPVYNGEKYIEETVNSVLNQSHQTFEIIIVNDGSTDNTTLIIENLRNSDPRIKVFQKSNTGVCDSRNRGISEASGNYMIFLDADDIWEKEFLTECLTAFHSDANIQAVYTEGQIIDADSNNLTSHIGAKTIVSVDDILAWKEGYVATPSCTIIKSSLIKEIGNWDTNLSTAADQDFFIRIAALHPIVAIDQPLFRYRVHENNMHQNIKVMEADHQYVFNKAKECGLFRNFWFKQRCYSNLYWILAGSWWKDGGNKARGLYYIMLALLTNPISIFRVFK